MDDESSSGVNLTTANHAIFVHPLLAIGQQQYDAYETQVKNIQIHKIALISEFLRFRGLLTNGKNHISSLIFVGNWSNTEIWPNKKGACVAVLG